MTIADDILDLLRRKRRLKLTAIDIAEMLYWEDNTYQQRVKADCLILYEQGKLTLLWQIDLQWLFTDSSSAVWAFL